VFVLVLSDGKMRFGGAMAQSAPLGIVMDELTERVLLSSHVIGWEESSPSNTTLDTAFWMLRSRKQAIEQRKSEKTSK
jgi:hypothetical protein